VGAWDLERKERKEGKTGENHDNVLTSSSRFSNSEKTSAIATAVNPRQVSATSGTGTGDKDPNTHQAHTGYIGSTDNK